MRLIEYTPTLGVFLMPLDAGQGARLHEAARALVLCATHTANTARYLLFSIHPCQFLMLLIHFSGKTKIKYLFFILSHGPNSVSPKEDPFRKHCRRTKSRRCGRRQEGT